MRVDKMGPPRQLANSGHSNNGGGGPRYKHKLMRQQFYTNNERSSLQQDNRVVQPESRERHARGALSAGSINRARPLEFHQLNSGSALDIDHGLHREHLSSSRASATTTLATLAQHSESNESPTLLLRDYAGGNSTAPDQHDPSTFMLTRDCLIQQGAHHDIQTGSTAPITGSAISAATGPTSLQACNDSQLSIMNMATEDYNFSDIVPVWIVKSWQEILLRVAFVAPIVLLGILGNATIIYSMCRFKPIRSKPTNIFILNMALADLITTIVCPNMALFTDIYQFYVLGSFVCRTEGFLKITCLLVSAYSLIVLSFDWFLSVVRPCRTRISIRQSWITLVAIWLVSVVMASPLLFSRGLRTRRWRDLTEVWCCELIQYTKYYWVCMTLFLIYLPTFIMTIVLVVILARMDRFEAKLRRSRRVGGAHTTGTNTATVAMQSRPSAAGVMRSSSFSIALDSLNQTTAANSVTAGNSGSRNSRTDSLGVGPQHSSLSISMKYRRRIVKILFFYLLTSIVCWTPLQFTIIYRHFRTEAVPAGWFFELVFFSQLCASLSAAMNPIIFGFLSQPFRRIVVRLWLFRLLDKLWTTRKRQPPPKAVDNNGARNNGPDGGEHAMRNRPVALVCPQVRLSNSNRGNCNAPAGPRAGYTRNDQEHSPKLTIEYIDHRHLQRHQSTFGRSTVGRTGAKQQHPRDRTHPQRPKSVSIVSHQHHRSSVSGRHPEPSIQRSHSSTASSARRGPTSVGGIRLQHNSERVLTRKPGDLGSHMNGNGIDNKAYAKAKEEEEEGEEEEEEEGQGAEDGDRAPPRNATTSFMAQNGAPEAVK